MDVNTQMQALVSDLEQLLLEYSELRRVHALLSRHAVATEAHVAQLRRIMEEVDPQGVCST